MPRVARTRFALIVGLTLSMSALAVAPAISATAVTASPTAVSDASTMPCIPTPTWSYNWNQATSSGTVTATGGYPGQPVCTPLYIRAVSWNYDVPLNGQNPSWPQTFSAKNDTTVASIGAFAFAAPGVSCGQDDVYATFSTSGFAALTISPVLTAPGAPTEPPFLHNAIAGVGGSGVGGSTWHTDPSASCTTTVSVLKRAVASGSTTALTSATAGSNFDYTIDVGNSGRIPATGLSVSDTLPAALTSTGPATGPGWTCTTVAQVVTCTLASPLAGSASAGTIRVPVQLTAMATDPNVANTATLCGTNIGACLSSQSVLVIEPPVVEPPVVEPPITEPPVVNPPDLPPLALSDLSLEKTASVTSVLPGGSYSYTFTASNPTTGSTDGVVVTDTLDPRLRLTAAPSGAGWACTITDPGTASGYGASFECLLPYGLATGSPKSFTAAVAVDPTADPAANPAAAFIDNTAEACGTSVDCDTASARVALSSEQLETLPLAEDPTTPGTPGTPTLGDLPTLALHDAALAHAGVDPTATTLVSLGALVLGLGLTVIAAGRRSRARQNAEGTTHGPIEQRSIGL